MRTLMFIVASLVLLAGCLGAAKLLSKALADAMRMATLAFVALWFVIAAANMWFGVAKGGYSVAEELPVFPLLFGLPAAVAIFVKWKFW